jgi:hypothetical protein
VPTSADAKVIDDYIAKKLAEIAIATDAVVVDISSGAAKAKSDTQADGTPSPDKEKDLVKAASAVPAIRRMRAMGLFRAVGKAGSKGGEVKTILNLNSSFTTTAATNYSTVINVVPGSCIEYGQFQALFDEVIVDSGHIDFAVTNNVAFTTLNGLIRSCWCFDPADSTALTSLSAGLQHSQSFQFTTPVGTGAAWQQVATHPEPVNRNGYFRFSWKTPKGVARSVALTTLFGHEWDSTIDSNAVYGYLKPWIPTAGATGTWILDYSIHLNVRFRCRA